MAAQDVLTSKELEFLTLYKRAHADTTRATRVTFQYVIGAGVFVILAITSNNPWWSIITFAVFAVYAALRLVRGRRLTSFMPTILAKYEHRIEELESRH